MRRIQYVLLLAVCLIAPTMAQDDEQIADLSGKAARVARAGNGGRLTEPSNAGRPEIVSAFLRGRHDEETATGLVVESENPTEHGPVHVRFRQQLAGLEVYGTYVKATLSPAGELVSVIENLASLRGQLLPSQLDFADALRTVLQRRYPGQPANLPEVASAGNSVTFGSRLSVLSGSRRHSCDRADEWRTAARWISRGNLGQRKPVMAFRRRGQRPDSVRGASDRGGYLQDLPERARQGGPRRSSVARARAARTHRSAGSRRTGRAATT